MNLDAPFVPPELFPENFPPTNLDSGTSAGTTGMCSTVLALTVVHF